MKSILIALATATAMSTFSTLSYAQTATTTVEVKETYITAQPTDVLSSNLDGLNIKNSRDEKIGEIKDVVLSDGKLAGYVVSVGGFLGMGEHYVVVSPKAVKINYSDDKKAWSAKMETTKELLKAAPAFKYEGRWSR